MTSAAQGRSWIDGLAEGFTAWLAEQPAEVRAQEQRWWDDVSEGLMAWLVDQPAEVNALGWRERIGRYLARGGESLRAFYLGGSPAVGWWEAPESERAAWCALARMIEVVEFYAAPTSYRGGSGRQLTPIELDGGAKAREAIADARC